MKNSARQIFGLRARLRILFAEGILNMDTYVHKYGASILALARRHPLSITRIIYDPRDDQSEFRARETYSYASKFFSLLTHDLVG